MEDNKEEKKIGYEVVSYATETRNAFVFEGKEMSFEEIIADMANDIKALKAAMIGK